MDWQNRLHALQLHNHEILNEEIDSIAELELHSLINCWKSHLRTNRQASTLKFERDERLIRTLKQTRTYRRVHLHRSRNDLSTDRVSASTSPRSGAHQFLIVTSSVNFVSFVFASPGFLMPWRRWDPAVLVAQPSLPVLHRDLAALDEDQFHIGLHVQRITGGYYDVRGFANVE